MLLVDDLAAGGTKNLRHTPRGLVTLISWGLETHVLLSLLWSAVCNWPVINVTLLTLKIVVLKIQD